MVSIEILRVVRIVTLILAGIVAYLAAKSYRRGGGRIMLYLSLGFSLIALGALLSGVFFEFFAFQIEESYAVESVLIALGLAVIVYSVYGTK